MILYHFTDFCFLEAEGTILKEGLKPSESGKNGMLPPYGVVWFTTEEDYRWHKGLASETDQCRIKLVIPSTDKRLVYWPKWARKHAPDIIEKLLKCDCGLNHRRQVETTYCYFGTVPLFYFREIEYADPARRLAFEQAGGRAMTYEECMSDAGAAS
jgi:hypothetical protein